MHQSWKVSNYINRHGEDADHNRFLENYLQNAKKKKVICESPRNCEILYFCNLTEESVNASDRYLVKNLLVAGKRAIRKIPTFQQ